MLESKDVVRGCIGLQIGVLSNENPITTHLKPTLNTSKYERVGLSLLDPRTLGQQERCVKWARACERDLPSGPGDQMMQFVRSQSI